jgi:hypothetical protein
LGTFSHFVPKWRDSAVRFLGMLEPCRSLVSGCNLSDTIEVFSGVQPRRISRFKLIRGDWACSPISCQNGAILRFGFLACRNRAGRLCLDETCRIPLKYSPEYQPRWISRFKLIRGDWARSHISCQNGAILRFGFLACQNRAGRLCPDETCLIAL